MSDGIDIVKQLRITAERYGGDFYTESIVDAAADEIERLRAEVERLTADNARLGFMLHPLGTTTQVKVVRND